MKTLLRLIGLILMVGGWAVAGLSLYVVRVPDTADPNASKFIVIPKARLGIADTYTDARDWKATDVPAHADLFRRVLAAGKADQFKFLTDPKSKEDAASQLNDQLKTSGHGDGPAATKLSMSDADRFLGFAISY